LNNSLTLQTERIAGFQLNAIYNNNNGSSNNTTTALPGFPVAQTATFTGTSTAGAAAAGTVAISGSTAASAGRGVGDQVAYGAGLNYVWQKLNVDAAFQTLKTTNFSGGTESAAALASNATAAAPGAANIFGTSIGQTQIYGGAVYDFGILKAYAQYVSNKAVSNINSNNTAQRTAQQIGIRSFVTPKIEVWASGGTGRLTASSSQSLATTNFTQNFTGYQLGSNYILSKRTNLYGIFGSTQVSSSSVAVSEGRSSYGLGLRHTF
jgi:hypothetical protein